MLNIVFWADGVWCYAEEAWQMTHRSDDFGQLEVPLGYEEWQIDEAVSRACNGYRLAD